MSLLKKFISKISSNNGLSLLELTAVISVVSAATVSFLSITQPTQLTDSKKAIITQERMRTIISAMEAFRVEKGRLPCPADPYMRDDNTRNSSVGGTDNYINDFGTEDLDVIQSGSNNDGGVADITNGVDCPVTEGIVPVYSLSLNKEYINDGWDRRITYKISDTVCSSDAGTVELDDDTSRLYGCTVNDYESGAGDIIIKDASGTTKVSNAVFALVSHGANGYGAFLPAGYQQDDTSASANEKENTDSDATFVKAAKSDTFDDIVMFKTKVQFERVTSRKNIKQISVADCEANSQALKNVTLSESGYMSSNLTTYERNSGKHNTGQMVALSMLKTIQSMCVKYYGAGDGYTPVNINGTDWHGAQCPGNNDPETNGRTYYKTGDICICADGSWDGNCTMDWTVISPPVTDNMVWWLDAADASTVHTATTLYDDYRGCNNTTNTTSGGIVACIDNKGSSEGGLNSSSPPIWKANGLGDKPTIDFNGGTSLSSASSLSYSRYAGSDSVTLLILFKPEAAYTKPLKFNVSAGVGGNRMWLSTPHSSGDIFWDFGVCCNVGEGRVEYTPNNFLNNWTLLTTDVQLNNSAHIYINGVLEEAGTMTSTLTGSSDFNIADDTQMEMAELIIYNVGLSNTERQSVESYLSDKWGITLN